MLLWRIICALRQPIPLRMREGFTWAAVNDNVGESLFVHGEYKDEEAERRFVARLLRRNSRIVDIGAHDGFYTLLAASYCGPDGAVIAFEPSPRERLRLNAQIVQNGFRNVTVEAFAVAAECATKELFIVGSGDTGRNSLQPGVHASGDSVSIIMAQVVSLDAYLEPDITVDFVKIDAEGAEMAILDGAKRLLSSYPRPVILCELRDSCAQGWGYRAREVYEKLVCNDFAWYRVRRDGGLQSIADHSEFECNLVAVPCERFRELDSRGLFGQRLRVGLRGQDDAMSGLFARARRFIMPWRAESAR